MCLDTDKDELLIVRQFPLSLVIAAYRVGDSLFLSTEVPLLYLHIVACTTTAHSGIGSYSIKPIARCS